MFWIQHNSQLPKNYKEKEAFRQLIREGNVSYQRFAMLPFHFPFSSGLVCWGFSFPFLRNSKEWERDTWRWRELWGGDQECEHGSEPHQGGAPHIWRAVVRVCVPYIWFELSFVQLWCRSPVLRRTFLMLNSVKTLPHRLVGICKTTPKLPFSNIRIRLLHLAPSGNRKFQMKQLLPSTYSPW